MCVKCLNAFLSVSVCVTLSVKTEAALPPSQKPLGLLCLSTASVNLPPTTHFHTSLASHPSPWQTYEGRQLHCAEAHRPDQTRPDLRGKELRQFNPPPHHTHTRTLLLGQRWHTVTRHKQPLIQTLITYGPTVLWILIFLSSWQRFGILWPFGWNISYSFSNSFCTQRKDAYYNTCTTKIISMFQDNNVLF